MIKRCIEARRRNGKDVQRLLKLKVYRDGVTASARYTFFNVEFVPRVNAEAFQHIFSTKYTNTLDNPSLILRRELEEYLRSHTKGQESEETWQVILQEHGSDREYYQLFAAVGCVTEDNLNDILTDIGGEYPEMKAYFLRCREENGGTADFFAGLEL